MSKALLLLSVLPTVIIFIIVIKNARARREPFRKVLRVFLTSVAAAIPAGIINELGMSIETRIFRSNGYAAAGFLYEFCKVFFIVGINEEFWKYITFKSTIFGDRDFDNTYDGIIYGAASALGFATIENIMYVSEGGLTTALLRAVTSIPLHAVTGIYMGYYFGIAKYKRYNNVQEDKNPQHRALILSMVMHGTYDFFAFASSLPGNTSTQSTLFALMVFVISIFCFILIGLTIKTAKREDLSIYNKYYYDNLNGCIQDRLKTTTYDPKKIPKVSAFPIFGAASPMGQGNYYQGQSFGGSPAQGGFSPFGQNARPNMNPYSSQQYGSSAPPPRPAAPAQKYCQQCGINVATMTTSCPICGAKL
nr:PrsW family intramembrane metalloprotease [Ruminococcus sp.]